MDGESEIKISAAQGIPVPEDSPEGKKRKLEQEDLMAQEFLNDVTRSSDGNNNSCEDLFTPACCDTEGESDCEKEKSKSTERRYNRTDLTPIIAAVINSGVSNYAAAAIINATLITYGIITPDSDSEVVTEHKIRDGKERYMEAKVLERNAAVSAPGVVTMVGFDAKANKPLAEKEINGHNYVVRGGLEDQYVVTTEPQGQYLTQFTVEEDATAERPYALIAAEVLKKSVEELGISWSQILIVGTDNENTNTGYKAGISAWLEHLIGHRLERANCTLHLNELPYRAVCRKMGMKTSSGDKWTGPIGKSLPHVQDMELNENFQPVSGETELLDLSSEIVDDLSSDQKTLYKLVKMVRTGEVIPNLQQYQMGKLGAARWLTHACAVLRLYCSHHELDEEESRKLKVIVKFIIDCYAPMWFLLKFRPNLTDAPKHWFTLLQISNRLDEEIREEVQQNITLNSFYFFCESILLCYVTSDKREEREYAVRMIKLIRCRQEDSSLGNKGPRQRKHPTKLNFSASRLDEVITEKEYKFESLLTCDIPSDKLDDLIDAPLQVSAYPSNTQSVERHIRGMTQAGQKVSTLKKRDSVQVVRQIVSHHYTTSKRTKKELHDLSNLSTATYSESLKNHKLQPKSHST